MLMRIMEVINVPIDKMWFDIIIWDNTVVEWISFVNIND